VSPYEAVEKIMGTLKWKSFLPQSNTGKATTVISSLSMVLNSS
jgi:hypothetical protein